MLARSVLQQDKFEFSPHGLDTGPAPPKPTICLVYNSEMKQDKFEFWGRQKKSPPGTGGDLVQMSLV
jgi:hypothetical protein